MPTLNELSVLSTINSGDLVPFFSNSNGDTFVVSVSNLSKVIQSLLSSNDDKITQYSSPSSTGFSVSIEDDSNSIYLILSPTATFAAGTIVFPTKSKCIDKQEILVSCTQIVSTLTGNGNGATLIGFPTTLAANSYFRMRYDIINSVWYRVG